MDLKKTEITVLAVVLLILMLAAANCVTTSGGAPAPAGQPKQVLDLALKNKTITDLSGRTVEIPAPVNHVACLVGPGYEKVALLGELDKVALVSPNSKTMPWAVQVFPNLKNIPVMTSNQDPNLEELMKQKVDVVFFWDYPKPLEKMTVSGIPVVVTQLTLSESQRPKTIDEFRKTIKDEVRIFGVVLGPEARQHSDEYAAYFDQKADRILAVTSKIPENEKPKVYYVRGPKALTTHGNYTYTSWWVNMAGGKLVSHEISQQVPDVTMEQVISWDPDIIIMGRVNNTQLITNDPKWKEVKAVKNGKVYLNPNGVMYWDYSSEGILLLEYLAKTFYPDKFPDLDMKTEVKEYYTKFYHYNLTDDEAGRILQYQNPV
jgi:iron complex transport system substrate-binding protein